ncbi:MAG: Enoyl-CoA hydratase @ Enoyl-CoA hydratase EchA5, partial [uncultured Solirubrobacterales bacterium]
AHHRPPRAPQRRRRSHRRAAGRRGRALRGRRRSARARPHRRGRGGLLRRRGPQGHRVVRAAPHAPRGTARLHPADPLEAGDRGDLGLVPGRRARTRSVVRPARGDRRIDPRLPGAALRSAPDRRRHPAAAAARRPRSRPRHDPHRSHGRRRGGPRDGPPHRDRRARPPPRARARDRRGARPLPAGDDALGPPGRAGGDRADLRGGAEAGGRGRLRGLRGGPAGRGALRGRRGSRRRGRRGV